MFAVYLFYRSAFEMAENTTVPTTVKTLLLVWDVNLKIPPYHSISIDTPSFNLAKEYSGDSSHVDSRFISTVITNELNRSTSIKFTISINFTHITDCVIYMMDLSINKITQIFLGFGKHTLDNDKWNSECCFLFELKLECDQQDLNNPAIWLRASMSRQPAISIHNILENELNQIMSNLPASNSPSLIDFVSNQNIPYKILIYPPNGDRGNVLTTLDMEASDGMDLQHCELESFSRDTIIILNVKSFKIMKAQEIETILSVLKFPQVTDYLKAEVLRKLSCSSKEDTIPLSCLYKYFEDSKCCDVTVHVQDQQIRVHKVVLINGSTVWRDLFFADETLAHVYVGDFDYGTVKELIDFIYTGNVKREAPLEQLIMASNKLGVSGLKILCESLLIPTIEMKTAVKLVVLAHEYNAPDLFSKVVDYIGKNRAKFRELDEAKTMFLLYPELEFKLFTSI